MGEKKQSGVLYLCPTPIGNLEDITLRSLRALKEVDFIAAEDTRRTRKLLSHYDIHTPLVSYHGYNKQKSGSFILKKLAEGKRVALVSDAGMPGISDPGAELVKSALKEGFLVQPLPGPTAGITALAASGFSTARFVFEGFLGSTRSSRLKKLKKLSSEERTMIFYEAPHRLVETLKDMCEVFGPLRKIAVGRELTKKYEEIKRGTIEEIFSYYKSNRPRGEFTLVVEGVPEDFSDGMKHLKVIEKHPQKYPLIEQNIRPTNTGGPGTQQTVSIVEEIQEMIRQGMDKREAIKKTARRHGLPKREVYAAVVKMEKMAGDL